MRTPIEEGLAMKKLAIFIGSVLLVFVGVCFSINTALAGDEKPNKPVLVFDVNQAP